MIKKKPITGTDSSWLNAAYVLVGISVAGALLSAGWIFGWDSKYPVAVENMALRARVLMPFATMAVAAITFATIVWRGKKTDRQVEEQVRQNTINDDASFSNLLIEGVKLLSDDEKPHHQIAGIAALETVIADPERRYSGQAMNILATVWARNYNDYTRTSYLEHVRRTMIKGKTIYGVTSEEPVSFSFDTDPPDETYKNTKDIEHLLRREWPEICGFLRQSYKNGKINKNVFETIRNDRLVHFINVLFSDIEFDAQIPALLSPENGQVEECTFQGCKFKRIYMPHLLTNIFVRCDFSGCEFIDFNISPGAPASNFKNCKFDNGNPPFEMFGDINA